MPIVPGSSLHVSVGSKTCTSGPCFFFPPSICYKYCACNSHECCPSTSDFESSFSVSPLLVVPSAAWLLLLVYRACSSNRWLRAATDGYGPQRVANGPRQMLNQQLTRPRPCGGGKAPGQCTLCQGCRKRGTVRNPPASSPLSPSRKFTDTSSFPANLSPVPIAYESFTYISLYKMI